MRRSPLRRGAPLQRIARLRPRRQKPRRSERERDLEYMARVKGLPCCAAHLGDCGGVIEADHAGRRPMGRKCHDRECIPLCTTHHRARTDFSGAFKTWTGQEMREWLDLAIAETQAALMVAAAREVF